MKKALSLILMLVMVFSALVPSMVLAADEINALSLVNLAAGKEVLNAKINGSNPNYCADLTDGVIADAISTDVGVWFGYWYHSGSSPEVLAEKSNTEDGGVAIPTIDLGGVYELDSVRMHIVDEESWGICAPTSAIAQVSNDGVTFTDVETITEFTPGVTWVEFDLTGNSAQYVRLAITLNSAWFFLDEIEIYGKGADAPAIQPDELVELPAGALTIDYAGYKHAGVYSIVAGDGLTVSELTALGNDGAAKDMNYAYIVVVDANGIVTQVWYELAVSKADVVCPEGGYIISYNGNKAGYADLAAIKEGATITLYNLNVDAFRGAEGNVELTGAGFTYENPADDPVVEIPENALKVDISHVNAYTWGVYNQMIIYGEGTNCLDIGYDCTWWLALKVENIDGVYTVTEIESNGETKDMVAPADGFLLYCFSNDADSYNAAGMAGIGATLFHATFDWTQNAASETPIGQLYFVPKSYGENVALGKPVQNAADRGNYNANLTDGVALGTLTYNAADWFGFYWNPDATLDQNIANNTNAMNGIANPIVDLGGLYDLTTIRVNMFTGNNSGISAPKSVKLMVSADGETYTEVEVRTFEWVESGTSKVEWIEFTLPEGTSAQYVCIEMETRTTFVFINEIEVYGTEADVHKHNIVHMEAVEPGCHYEGLAEHWYCTDCETVWADEALTQITNHKNVIIPATGSDLLVHMDAVEPGCHYVGNIEYWICYECEQVWADEALTQLTNVKNVLLPELGGDVIHVEAVAPGCGVNGNIEHWYCEECEQVWQDEARTQLTNRFNVILPAFDHEFDEDGICGLCGEESDLFVSIDVGAGEANVGDTITVDIVLDRNNGFAHLSLDVLFDTNIFELVSVSNGAIIENFASGAHLVWSSATNVTETGVLATLTLKVKSGVTAGSYDIALAYNEAWNESELAATIVLSGNSIAISDVKYGDVDGDGALDGKDATLLLRYLANYNPQTGESTFEVTLGADVNGDGALDGKDATLLLRYLANYNPQTGESSITLGPSK